MRYQNLGVDSLAVNYVNGLPWTLMLGNPSAGKAYFVSKQGNNRDGSNWQNAFTTLAAAITENNLHVSTTDSTSINFNKMNRIYVDGGNYTESLTVFPNHCEMIGVGGAPSRINASTVLTTAPSVCHIYNMQFRTTTGAPVVLLPYGSQGVEFHGCIFNGSGVTPTIGLSVDSGCYAMKVMDCEFIGLYSATCGIKFLGPITATVDIVNNFISAVTYGIYFSDPHTSSYQVLIKENTIGRSDGNYGTQLAYGIYDADTGNRSDVFAIHNWISAGDALYGMDANKTIQNYVVVAGNGIVETETA